MVMRVTQQNIYSTVIDRMNYSLSDLMESNIQAATQKKVNKPSDDPVGTVRILSFRDTISQLDQYGKNISSAKGWLNLADNAMVQVNTIITRCKELAEQGSTGTISAENREQISFEVRQLFEQLVGLSNTSFEDNTLFSGHKTSTPAFEQTLWLTDNDGALSNATFSISGDSATSVLIQFASGGAISTQPSFRYSSDGGDTWSTGSYTPLGGGVQRMNLGGGLAVDINDSVVVTASQDINDSDGTWLWVRPTARYLGDDKDGVGVDPMQNTSVLGSAAGTWNNNVVVRIDETTTLSNASIRFSYSLDGGSNWIQSNVSSPDSLGNSASFVVPGGILTLSSNGGNQLSAGEQFVIRPRTADINMQISQSQTVTINGVGKDIFGGIYTEPGASGASAVTINGSLQRNLFETVGKLVGYLETNNQDGCQQALEDLRESSQTILNYAANVGGRENRLETAASILQGLTYDNNEQLSDVEDVDLAALMTKLAQQELAYQAVLKSSSMIMQLSLVGMI
jgi:flagellar hook-associated protein 3 FlgL